MVRYCAIMGVCLPRSAAGSMREFMEATLSAAPARAPSKIPAGAPTMTEASLPVPDVGGVAGVAFAADERWATVHAQHEDGRMQDWQARFVVDASGRDTLLGKQLDAKRRNPRHNSSALYAHFRGATRHPGRDEGNITI